MAERRAKEAAILRVADISSEHPLRIRCILILRALKFRSSVFKGDVMCRRIVIVLFSLFACLVVEYPVAAQQAPSAAAQPAGDRGRGPGAPAPPPLFFKETWHIVGQLMR